MVIEGIIDNDWNIEILNVIENIEPRHIENIEPRHIENIEPRHMEELLVE